MTGMKLIKLLQNITRDLYKSENNTVIQKQNTNQKEPKILKEEVENIVSKLK